MQGQKKIEQNLLLQFNRLFCSTLYIAPLNETLTFINTITDDNIVTQRSYKK